MITKRLELVSSSDNRCKLCNIKIQVNDEDYDRILNALNHSEADTKVRIGASIMKAVIRVPQVRAVLPEHLVDLGLKNTIKKINLQLDQVSKQYGLDQICIKDKSDLS